MLKLRDWIDIKKLKLTFLLKNPNDIKLLKENQIDWVLFIS